MNRYMGEEWWWIEGSHEVRDDMLGVLNDADLGFSPGGSNLTLGELFRQMGEVEYSYLHGLKTLAQDWEYHNTEDGLAASTSRLLSWFHELDDELKTVVSAFSDDDLAKEVTRASGFAMPVEMSLDIYVQAVLIFAGKAVVYLRAMDKPIPKSVEDWIW
jgi:hypothetical protein